MKKSEMYCGYCGHTDEMILTSIPPKVKCLITAECHNLGADCNIEFAPIKHGRWIGIDDSPYKTWECNKCGKIIVADEPPNYCERCGAKMRGVENE